MKALTVQQPWAWAIVHGGKDVENRSRNIAGAYRGTLAIHAGLKIDWDNDWLVRLYAATEPPALDAAPRGAIVGVVDLVGVHQEPYWSKDSCSCSDWAELDAWHLLLANPRPLREPIPCRGALGLWTPPDDVVAQLGGAVVA